MKKLKSDYKAVAVLMFLICIGLIVSASLFQNSGNRNTFSVSIVSPTGGEEWQGNTEHTISYNISDGVPNYTVELYYTTDSQTFTPIHTITNQTEGEHTYPWTTPNITSNTVQIRVNITDSSSATTSNLSETFEIDSTEPNAVSDLSAQATSYDTITLTWTAPGEDGELGRINITQDEIPDLIIPDNSETGITSNITVEDNLIIYKTRVYLRINHTCVGDLKVKLSHPDGTTITLFNKTGGGSSNLWGWYEDGNFGWEGSGNIAPTSGDSLSTFNYKGTQGVWELWVADTVAQELGVIDYWVLQLFAQPVSCYKIRYNTSAEVTEANWNDSMPYVSTPLPALPGTTQNITITGLEAGVKYYFGLRSEDNAGWESEVSNSPNGTTRLYVQVLSPNGDVVWSGKSLHTIRYKFSGAKSPSAPESEYTARIYYIYENGTVLFTNQSWLNLTEECTCDWNTPCINSTGVKILVNVTTRANYSYGEDESDSNFTIDSVLPYVVNATSNVSILPDTPITIEFSEPMNRSSVESAFSSTPSFVGISWSWNDNFTIATISHDNFPTGTYNCAVNTTAKDISDPGNCISANYTFSFSAVAPLEATVIYPTGGDEWNGTRYQNIYYSITGGKGPYNVSLYWVNDTDKSEGFIGYEERAIEGTYNYSWLPLITNNTLKIRINVTDNTTPRQQRTAFSAGIFETDSTPPGKPKLKDFELEPEHDSIAKEGYPRANAVKIKWVASGDDEFVGKPKYYHIKYSTQPIIESNWANIISFINYTAIASGNSWESYAIGSLASDTNYYFALKAYDNVGFVSEISNFISSIKTLKSEIWPDTIQGAPGVSWNPINKTLYFTEDKIISYTEVEMRGSLLVMAHRSLTFDKVLFNMAWTGGGEPYTIQILPGSTWRTGGVFDISYSNITAMYPNYPYVIKAWPNSIFWLSNSSINYCNHTVPGIGRGIEIDSGDVWIDNSIITYSQGIFITDSLPRQGSPKIVNSEFWYNVYGIVIKPGIGIAEQLPINLIGNKIHNSVEAGLDVDSARVGLDSCWFIGNKYGAIYNNIPSDWPYDDTYNVSGVIYHCVFENNSVGINSFSSSLKLITSTFAENTEGIRCNKSSLNITSESSISGSVLGVNSTLSSITVRNSDVINNTKAADSYSTAYETYFVYEETYDTGIFGGIYCKGSSLIIENSIISNNLNGITLFLTPVDISNSMLTQNQYIIINETGSPLKDSYGYIMWDGWGVYSEGSVTMNILDSDITNNEYGVISLFSFLNVTNNNISYNGDDVSDYGIGLLWGYGEANITNNTFFGNDVAMYGIGNVEIPNVMQILVESMSHFRSFRITPITSRLMGMTENINVKGGVFNNTFIGNEDGIYVISGSLTLAENYINGVMDFVNEIYGINLLCIEADLDLINTQIDTGLVGIYYLNLRLNMVNSSISLMYYPAILSAAGDYLKFEPENMDWEESSTITIENSMINNSGSGMVIGAAPLSITDSEISNCAGCWWRGYGYNGMDVWGCSVSISNTTISNVNYCSFTDCSIVTVANDSQFTGCVHSLEVTDSKLYVTDCLFNEDNAGVYSSNSEIHVKDSIFSNISTGIFCTGSSGSVLNNRFKGCSNFGIDLTNTFLTIGITDEGNHFIDVNIGIRCTHSSPSIADNKFLSSGVGVVCWDSSSPEIVDNSFYDLVRQGVYSEQSSPNIVNNSFANISKGIECKGSNPIIVNNIIIYAATGVYSISSSLLMKENSIINCNYNIYCHQSSLNLTDDTISYSNEYGIYCTKSSLGLMGVRIINSKYGIYAVSSDVIISNSSISNNSYGAYFRKSSLSISDTTIADNSVADDSYGVYLYKCPDPAFPGTPVKIVNSIIINNKVDLNFSSSGSGSSPVELINCTINKIYLYDSSLDCVDFTPDFNNITFADNSSKMEVSFYLTVNVTWYNVTSGGLNNEPANNASVKIYNRMDNLIINTSTDKSGIVAVEVLALTMNKTTLPDGVTFMPHRVNASKYDISNETEPFYVNETRYVELVLYDLKNPSMYINPVFFNITNEPSLTLTGTASDNIEVWKVEVSIDNTTWSGCSLTVTNSTIGNYTVSWSGSVTLNEGLNTVYVRAKDFAGNNITDSVTITLDTTPPSLIITSPIPKTTNQSALTIIGKTEPGAVLTINTVSVDVDDNGNFSETFNLNEGVNVFTVVASDSLGNENRKVLSTIVFDNTPPTSGIAHINDYINSLTTITGIANDDVSGVKKVEICIIKDGYYRTGSAWSSTETWLNASGTSTWSYSWTPKTDGVYTIKSRATDNANNTETPSPGVTFTYDKTPPTLTNIKPSNNTETELETLTVSGETDGVNVTINGEYADVKDGEFSTTVPLGSGNNTITIIAKDLAGNTNQTTITVKKISIEGVPPATQWTVLLVGVIVIALMIAVFVLYKKKIIKLKAPKKKTETGKVRENVLHKEKMGTGKPKENIVFSFEGGSKLK